MIDEVTTVSEIDPRAAYVKPADAKSSVSELVERITKAMEVVSALSQGTQRWVMSVPAQPDSDPDLVISAGLQAGMTLLSALADAERERDAANERCAAAVEDYNVQLAGHRLSAKQSTENLLRATAAESKLAEAVKVINALTPSHRAPGCWCNYSHDIASFGHQTRCTNARDFIASMKGDGE